GEATPDSVRRSVLLRLARLSDHARSLAAALSILGVGASLDHAAEVAELDRSSAAEAADALAAADIIARARPLEFLHPIVRAAVARLPPGDTPSPRGRRDVGRRRARHRALAGSRRRGTGSRPGGPLFARARTRSGRRRTRGRSLGCDDAGDRLDRGGRSRPG